MCAACSFFMICTSIPHYGTSGSGSCSDGSADGVGSVSGGPNVGGGTVDGTTTTGPGSTGCSPGVRYGGSASPAICGISGPETPPPGLVGCAPGPWAGTVCRWPELPVGTVVFDGAPHDAVSSASATTDNVKARRPYRPAFAAFVVVDMIGPPHNPSACSEGPRHAVKAHAYSTTSICR
jgi:hypothetical protein